MARRVVCRRLLGFTVSVGADLREQFIEPQSDVGNRGGQIALPGRQSIWSAGGRERERFAVEARSRWPGFYTVWCATQLRSRCDFWW